MFSKPVKTEFSTGIKKRTIHTTLDDIAIGHAKNLIAGTDKKRTPKVNIVPAGDHFQITAQHRNEKTGEPEGQATFERQTEKQFIHTALKAHSDHPYTNPFPREASLEMGKKGKVKIHVGHYKSDLYEMVLEALRK